MGLERSRLSLQYPNEGVSVSLLAFVVEEVRAFSLYPHAA